MKTTELNDKTCILSLCGRICPACGKRKGAYKTLCGGDYASLPAHMKKALYNKVRFGYREAVIEALTFLNVTEPHLPGKTLF